MIRTGRKTQKGKGAVSDLLLKQVGNLVSPIATELGVKLAKKISGSGYRLAGAGKRVKPKKKR